MKCTIGPVEIRIELWRACEGARGRDNNADVTKMLKSAVIRSQLVRYTDDELAEALGARSDRAGMERRLVWLACHKISEERDN